jgi:hypothetical protein
MKHASRMTASVLTLLLISASQLDADRAVAIKVTPAVALAPAYLSIRITIESNAENRGLEVVTESRDFFSSSQIQLDGEHAPRISVVNLEHMPAGMYEVTGILIGPRGARATASQRVMVAQAVGPERRPR